MKISAIIVAMLVSLQLFAQKHFPGTWKITGEKTLTLNQDNTFSLQKGAYDYSGTWSFEKVKKASPNLNLDFGTKVISYRIDDISKDEVRLYDSNKDQVLILSRIPELEASEEENQETLTREEVKKKYYWDRPFRDGSFVINPGYGLIDYVDSFPSFMQNNIPALSLLMEKSLGYGIGVGMKLGYRSWKEQESRVESALYTAGLRFTYHASLLRWLDPYIGGGVVLRYGIVDQPSGSSGKWSSVFTPTAGARIFLGEHLALTGEYAYDSSTNVTVGFAFSIH